MFVVVGTVIDPTDAIERVAAVVTTGSVVDVLTVGAVVGAAVGAVGAAVGAAVVTGGTVVAKVV